MNQINEASSNEQLDSYYKRIKEKSKHCNGDDNAFENVDEEAVLRASSGAQSYKYIEKRERAAKAHRHEIINELIQELEEPLSKEQKSKNTFRTVILIGFTVFFLGITIATFALLFEFSKVGFTQYNTQVSNILISGLFVNIVGLAVIIFKYLFDDKNSLLKEMIQLVSNTLRNDDGKHS